MNVWIASLRGLSKIAGQRFANYRKEQGLLEDEVTAILRRKDGRVVFGHNSGVTFFDGRSFRPLPFPKRSEAQFTGARVLDLYEDRDGVLWAAASSSGLARISPDGSVRWFGREAGLVGQVSSVVDGGNGRLLISSNQGMRLFSGDRAVAMPGTADLPLYLRKIGHTLDGRLFATSSSVGIYILETRRLDAVFKLRRRLCEQRFFRRRYRRPAAGRNGGRPVRSPGWGAAAIRPSGSSCRAAGLPHPARAERNALVRDGQRSRAVGRAGSPFVHH